MNVICKGNCRIWPGNTVNSLTTQCINAVLNNFVFSHKDIQNLQFLPPAVKQKLLKRLINDKRTYREENEIILSVLLDSNTRTIEIAKCTDNILKYLTKCHNLRSLHLVFQQHHTISSSGLSDLFKCLNHLQILHMPRCEALTDEVMKAVGKNCPNLRELDINWCSNITNEAFKELAKLNLLTCLSCSFTMITDEAIYHLAYGNSAKNIQELRINNCSQITDRGIKLIVEKCPNITTLCFNHTSVVEFDECFTYILENCKKITQLNWSIQ